MIISWGYRPYLPGRQCPFCSTPEANILTGSLLLILSLQKAEDVKISQSQLPWTLRWEESVLLGAGPQLHGEPRPGWLRRGRQQVRVVVGCQLSCSWVAQRHSVLIGDVAIC